MPRCRKLKIDMPSNSLEGVELLEKVVLTIRKERPVLDQETGKAVLNIYGADFELVHPYWEHRPPTYKKVILPIGSGAGFSREKENLTRGEMNEEKAKVWAAEFLRTRVVRYIGKEFNHVEPRWIYRDDDKDRSKGALRVTGIVYTLSVLPTTTISIDYSTGNGNLEDFLLMPE